MISQNTWSRENSTLLAFISSFLRNQKFTIESLTGDASSRKYFRFFTCEKKQSYVLMAWEPFDSINFPFFNVQKYFKLNKIKVPEILDFDSQHGLVILEDLGDHSLETEFWSTEKQEKYIPYYEKTLEELLKIQFYSTIAKGDCIAFTLNFDTEKLNWELQHTKKNLLIGLLKISNQELDKYQVDVSFKNIAERLHEQPQYIQHRDFHSRNIMIKNDETRIIDFQDARLGAIQYDLVSLFKDSYVNFPELLEKKLLAEYFNEAKKITPIDASYEHFSYIYELQTIQRCLKAAGSFASFYVLKNDARYLKYLSQTLNTVQSSLQLFPEYKNILTLFEHYKLTQIDFEKEFLK